MLKRKEAAKFLCGFETDHALLHAYLWLSGTTLTAVGITFTPALNIAGVVVNAIIAMALGIYGWKRPAPSLREVTA